MLWIHWCSTHWQTSKRDPPLAGNHLEPKCGQHDPHSPWNEWESTETMQALRGNTFHRYHVWAQHHRLLSHELHLQENRMWWICARRHGCLAQRHRGWATSKCEKRDSLMILESGTADDFFLQFCLLFSNCARTRDFFAGFKPTIPWTKEVAKFEGILWAKYSCSIAGLVWFRSAVRQRPPQWYPLQGACEGELHPHPWNYLHRIMDPHPWNYLHKTTQPGGGTTCNGHPSVKLLTHDDPSMTRGGRGNCIQWTPLHETTWSTAHSRPAENHNIHPTKCFFFVALPMRRSMSATSMLCTLPCQGEKQLKLRFPL